MFSLREVTAKTELVKTRHDHCKRGGNSQFTHAKELLCAMQSPLLDLLNLSVGHNR